jgi:hypothetical protein
MSNTRTITYALAAAGALFIGSDAIAQNNQGNQGNGPAAVTVTNTPLPVTVTNPTPPLSTVNVGNGAALAAANAQAIAKALGVGTPAVLSFKPAGLEPGHVSVPQGQRFVIEYVSGSCNGPTQVGLDVVTNTVSNLHRFTVPNAAATWAFPLFQFGQVVKIYADPGSTITQDLSEGGGGNFCEFVMSGQLVTL